MKSLFSWTTQILSFCLLHRINAIDVSVCLDATYALASSQESNVCSGSGDKLLGISCPVKGDLAVADCHAFLPSFIEDEGCILHEDAECRIITGTTWGCVLPSSGCKHHETQCPTWVVTNSNETRDIDVSHFFIGNESDDENWFVQTSPVSELYHCGEKPTPTLTEAPRSTTSAPSTLKPALVEPPTAMPTREPTFSPLKPRTPSADIGTSHTLSDDYYPRNPTLDTTACYTSHR